MMNQTEFLTSTFDLLKALETLSAQCPIEFGFSFHLLKNWIEIFQPMTMRSNCSRVITFDRQSFENCDEKKGRKVFDWSNEEK